MISFLRYSLVLAISLFLFNSESFSQCTTTITSFPYSESFETSLGGWTGNTSATVPPANGFWGRNSGTTISGNTGPTGASQGSFYVYTEASGTTAGTVLNLISPCFQLPSGALNSIFFDYHMLSLLSPTSMGTLALQVNTNPSGSTWTTIWTISGSQGTQWNSQIVSLSAYAGQTIQLRFQGTLGNPQGDAYAGDRAIDNIRIQAPIQQTPIYCQGGSTGGLSINTTGLITPLTFAWSNGASTSAITGISAGTYTVTVTDGNSTSYTLSSTLADGNVPIVAGLYYEESFESYSFGTWFNDSLNDNFNWSLDYNGASTTPTGPTSAADGTFYAYTEASGPAASARASLVSSCFDLSDMNQPYFKFDYHMRVQGGGGTNSDMGQLFLIADTTPLTPLTGDTIWFKSGAQGNNWLSDSVDLSPYTGTHITLRFTGVLAASGNTQYGDRAIDGMYIKDALTITPACSGLSGGAISVIPSFGTGPYIYNWSNGSTASSISGLASGTYTITITDALFASQIQSITVDTIQIPTPSGVNASALAFCANQLQTVTLNLAYIDGDAVFNGSTPILNDGGPSGTVGTNLNFSLTGTPSFATGPGQLTIYYRGDMEAPGEFVRTYSENGVLIGKTQQAVNQCSGTYSAKSFTIPTDSINSWAVNDTIGLFGESIGMTRYCGLGGGQAYSWQAYYELTYPYTTVVPYWFAGSCDSVIANAVGSGFFVDVNPSTTTTYYVRYYNTACNEWGDCQSITVNVNPVPLISVTPPVASFCSTPVSLTASGANTYSWGPGTGLNTTTGATVLASPASSNTYIVTGTNATGCSNIATVNVTVVPSLSATVSITSNATCFGAANGAASVSATAGSGVYTYAWSNGSTTNTASGLSAGAHSVTVTDNAGCSDVETFSITQPTPVVVTLNSSNPCNGNNNGTITAIGTGGNGIFTYAWSSGQTTGTINGLLAGNYTVTATDGNGCFGTGSQTLNNSTMTVAMTSDSVNCLGGNDGSATATPTGGTAPYFYNWLNSSLGSIGQFTQTAAGLTAGTYFAQVSGSNGCSVFSNVVVGQPNTFVTTSIASSTNVSCNGGNDGSATASAVGGTGSTYTFAWSNGQSGPLATGLSAGLYVISATDSKGCTDTAHVTITQPAPLAITFTSANALCNGSSDGTATATATGGTSPFNYAWSTGATTASINGLAAGTYTVTSTDANLCTAVNSVVITQPTPITNSFTVANASCFGSATGSATASPSGGTGAFTFLWSNGQTAATATGLTAGSYTVTVTDANGCTFSNSTTITQPAILVASTSLVSNVLCFGGNTGSASASATGGTSPYTYAWSNGQTTATATGLASGTFTVTVTDANSCTDTETILISQPAAPLSASITAQTNVACNGASTGSATATAAGGTSTYSFAWSNGQTTATATALASGTYTATITDANGCTTTTQAIITQPAPITINFTSTNALCNGSTDGTAVANPTGGTGAFTFLWSTGATTATINGLSAGTYTVTATDANLCTAVNSVVITQPTPITNSFTVANASCFGSATGSATASPSGGTGAFTFIWSNGQTAATATGLTAGSYTVTVTDANGCTFSNSTTITQPAILVASTSLVSNVLCFGGNTGSASASATGGTSPYTYAWSNGQTTATATGLASGTFTVTVTDANSCTDTETILISQPAAPLSASITAQTNVACNGASTGSATATAAGGTSTYSFAWSNGQTTATATALAAGTYTATITDANGCTTTTQAIITEPAPITINFTSTNALCNGSTDGTAVANPTGGTGAFTFLWSTGATTAAINGLSSGTYTVTATDANLCTAVNSVVITQPTPITNSFTTVNASCNGSATGSAAASPSGGTGAFTFLWSNGQTAATATGLTAGTYTVTVTDANGCAFSNNTTITQPAILVASTSLVNNVLCFGGATGSASASAFGGTSPYTYAWSNGQTAASATGLSLGTYTVTVTDANSCSDTETITISEPASALSISISASSNALCSGSADGTASATATGGTSPYSYAWSNGQSGASATGLIAGTYVVTATDANGCTNTASVNITQPIALVASTVVDSNASCNGALDGGATASATGGTSPYTYLWSNGSTTASITGIVAGTYLVTITDFNNCSSISTATITEPALLVSSAIADSNASCNGVSDGGATASATGGTAPYTYVWSNGATTASITGLSAGNYSVTVTDANACSNAASVNITEPITLLAFTIIDSNVSCNTGNNGGVSANVLGGTSPYTYAWSNGATTASITGLIAGIYTVTITDANGCFDSATDTIIEPTPIIASSMVDSNASCFGSADGGATASATGGTAPYSYAWATSTGPVLATTASINGLLAGSYSVTITDANGCSDISTLSITEPSLLIASSFVDSTLSCNGSSDGGASSSATGGTAPYTFVWSNGSTTASITGVAAGTYIATITDANGCFDTTSIIITEPDTLVASILLDSNASCNGAADGGATASAFGGTAPFTYAWSNGSATASAIGLSAGTYTVTVTDANGCFDTETIIITEPLTLVASAIADSNVSCNSGADGGATSSATGGTMPYTYLWNNGATTSSISGISAGTYAVTITDDNGCFDSASVTLTEPTPLVAASIADSNVSCNAGNDGGATASASGGTAPYSYSWSTSTGLVFATTASISGIVAGTYSVTATDANGCTDTSSVLITEPTLLIASSVADSNTSCNGSADGGATASATGGTMPHTYSWDNGATTSSITGIAAGTYIATITDLNGCTDTTSVLITEPDTLFANVLLDSNTSCNGTLDGGGTASSIGGTSPYTYLWSNGATTASVTGLGAGTYTVTSTDANGCFNTSTITITEPSVLIASAVLDSNVSCFSGNDGGASASAVGGTAPYSYLWSTSTGSVLGTTASITGIAAGSYTVIITDTNGCFDSTSITISEPTALVSSVIIDSNVSCNSGSDAGATASASGGTAPYTYLWSNGQTSATATTLNANTHFVTVTDFNGCFVIDSAMTTEPLVLVATATADTNVGCFGDSTGAASAMGMDGTAPYTYLWSTGAITASISGLAAGSYTVTITDANGCTDTAQAIISEPTALSTTITLDSNVACFGTSTGGLTAVTNGGSGPYFFNWSNGPTSALNPAVPAGSYTVVIFDQNGCIDSASAVVTEPTLLVTTTTEANAVNCFNGNDGTASTSPSGGTGPYTYLWSNGSTIDSAFSLSAGMAFVTISDVNACFIIDSVTITEPSAALVSTTVAINNTLCFGDTNGLASISAAGGTAPYTYSWFDGSTNDTISLSAGVAFVTVSDANACTYIDSVTITEPNALIASISTSTDVSCYGLTDGTASASANGGTGIYTYAWSTGSTSNSVVGLDSGLYLVSVTDANGCMDTSSVFINAPDSISNSFTISNASCFSASDAYLIANPTGGNGIYSFAWSNALTTDSIGGLTAGTYSLTITDGNGCQNIFSETISEPDSLVTSINLVNSILCNGDSSVTAQADVIGGTSPYSYAWPAGFTQSNDSVFGLPAGLVTVTVTDANNCTAQASATIAEPTQLTVVNDSLLDVNCIGGSDGFASVLASGGTGVYTYAWDNGSVTNSVSNVTLGTYCVTVTDANGCTAQTCITIGETNALPIVNLGNNFNSCDPTVTLNAGNFSSFMWNTTATTQTINVTSAANYSVTVTDANGCMNSDQIAVGFYPTLAYNLTTDSSACNLATGAAHITNLTGGGGYSINWSTGQVGGLNLVNIASGNYTVSVSDQNGCSLNTPFAVQDLEPLSPVYTVADVTCFNGADGSIVLDSIVGGTAPFTFNWSTGSAASGISSLAVGTYNVTITGALGCESYQSYAVGNAAPITFNLVALNSTCTDSNGSIEITNLAPLGTYTYAWNDYLSQVTDSAISLPAGNYTVTVTNANGCTKTASAIVNDLFAATISTSTVDAVCFNQNSGTATVNATGNAPFNYSWNDPASQTLATAVNLANGTYLVTVTDANSCITIDSAVVGFVNSNPALTLGADTAVCDNFLTLSPGAGFVSYAWSNGNTNATISASASGVYAVTVTDANTCEASDTIIVALNAPVAFVSAVTNSNCNTNSGSIAINVLTGGGSYIYNWSNGTTNDSLLNVGAGTYGVTVSDTNGCSSEESIIVLDNNAAVLTATTLDLICNDAGTGEINVSATGGTGTLVYSWNNGSSTAINSGLAAGNYSVTVTDALGCIALGNYTLTEPAPIAIGFTVDQSACGVNDGAILAAITGTQGPATYAWNDPSNSDSVYVANLFSGLYTITVTDSAGCVETNSAIVNDLGAAVVSTGAIDNNCDNEANGVAFATATGLAPLSYLWDDLNAQTTDTATNLVNGSYFVFVTDASGCLTIASTSVGSFNDAPIISLGNDRNVCEGSEVILTPGGGFVSYAWSNGSTATDISVSTNDDYSVIVVDVNGCSNQDEVNVSFVLPPFVDLGSDTLVCVDDGATLVIDATNAFINYAWSTGDTTTSITISQSGLYSVTVDNGGQCLGSDRIIVVFDTCINVGDDELDPFAAAASLKLYPNPTRGNFTIETEGLPTGSYLVKISSLGGQAVERRTMNVESGNGTRDEYNLSNAAQGVYILTIEGRDIQLNQRIIIQ